MNSFQHFFREDIPAVMAAWKLRIQRGQLNSRLAQLEKDYEALLTELGTQTWAGRVQDPGYSETYAQLDVLDASRSQVQQEIDAIQSSINQENDRLKASTAEFEIGRAHV